MPLQTTHLPLVTGYVAFHRQRRHNLTQTRSTRSSFRKPSRCNPAVACLEGTCVHPQRSTLHVKQLT